MPEMQKEFTIDNYINSLPTETSTIEAIVSDLKSKLEPVDSQVNTYSTDNFIPEDADGGRQAVAKIIGWLTEQEEMLGEKPILIVEDVETITFILMEAGVEFKLTHNVLKILNANES